MKFTLLFMLILSSACYASYENNIVSQYYTTCGIFHNQRKLGLERSQFYVQGIIDEYNILTPNTYSIIGNSDITSVMLWLDKYCNENPLSSLNSGIGVLIKELYPNRTKAYNKIIIPNKGIKKQDNIPNKENESFIFDN